MTWALAGAVGPVIGGVLTEKVSWRWCFYINRKLDALMWKFASFLHIRTRMELIML